MFRGVCRSSSGASTVFAASGFHTHVVTGRSQVWVGTGFPPRLDYGRSPHAYGSQRLQIQLGLLMMSDIPLETCWAFNELGNNKFRYQVASCWLLLLKNDYVWECWSIYTGKGLARATFEPDIFPYKYSNIFKPSHPSYLPAYEDGTDRVFRNVGI